MNVNLGRVYVGGAPPASQTFNVSKLGTDGTYFDVSTSGDATSSLNGRYNAFHTGTTDSRMIEIGLNPSTATAGLKTGLVTIDNLDVTNEGGIGHGANDGDDIFNVSLDVVDHPVASFSLNLPVNSASIDFGTVAIGQQATSSFDSPTFPPTACPQSSLILIWILLMAAAIRKCCLRTLPRSKA